MAKVIRRTWIKKSQISEYNDFLDIWDSGSHLYERWSDGTENFWKVISREFIKPLSEAEQVPEADFIEVLQEVPVWMAPGQVMHQERRAFLRPSHLDQSHPLQFQGWNVQQEELQGTSCKKHNLQVHSNQRPQAHSNERMKNRPQVHIDQRPQVRNVKQVQRPSLEQQQLLRQKRPFLQKRSQPDQVN
jgi:hypothetical protein